MVKKGWLIAFICIWIRNRQCMQRLLSKINSWITSYRNSKLNNLVGWEGIWHKQYLNHNIVKLWNHSISSWNWLFFLVFGFWFYSFSVGRRPTNLANSMRYWQLFFYLAYSTWLHKELRGQQRHRESVTQFYIIVSRFTRTFFFNTFVYSKKDMKIDTTKTHILYFFQF